MAYEEDAVIVAAADRTTSGNSGAQITGKALNLSIIVEVTANSGTTPTLDFSVEWSADGVNFAVAQPADNFTQITTVVPTRVVKSFSVKADNFRVVWVIAGTTPHYTFQVTRYAVGA